MITDTLVAQDRMRQAIHGVGFALMIATALHSIATGNLLPAWVKVVCVDINPATVTKLGDRGTFQTIGLVTDVEPFLRSLAGELAAARRCEAFPWSSRRDRERSRVWSLTRRRHERTVEARAIAMHPESIASHPDVPA